MVDQSDHVHLVLCDFFLRHVVMNNCGNKIHLPADAATDSTQAFSAQLSQTKENLLCKFFDLNLIIGLLFLCPAWSCCYVPQVCFLIILQCFLRLQQTQWTCSDSAAALCSVTWSLKGAASNLSEVRGGAECSWRTVTSTGRPWKM